MEHLERRGMEYESATRTRAGALRGRSVRAYADRDGDGKAEELACGPLRRLGADRARRTAFSAATLAPAGGSGLSGLLTGRERARRAQLRLVLADGTAAPDRTWSLSLASGRCGAPAGQTSVKWEVSELDANKNVRTASRRKRSALRGVRSLRVARDADGDGIFEPHACGPLQLWGQLPPDRDPDA